MCWNECFVVKRTQNITLFFWSYTLFLIYLKNNVICTGYRAYTRLGTVGQKQVADVLGFLMFVDILVTKSKKIDNLRVWKHCWAV